MGRRQWDPTPVLLLGKSYGQRSLVGCTPWGREELDTTERLHFHFSLSCIGEGNGNPLQCSCLENPRDRGAWWAAVYGVTQIQTRLMWLSSNSSSLGWMDVLEAAFTVSLWLSGKNPPANPEDTGLNPGAGGSPGRWHGNPLWYYCLENSMDRGACTFHGATRSRTWLSNWAHSQFWALTFFIPSFSKGLIGW